MKSKYLDLREERWRRLVELRHELHREAEISEHEASTAEMLRNELHALGPELVIDSIGGHGVAAVFRGVDPGPTLLLRADMDALPLDEAELPHASRRQGVAHKCGHDGHMTMLLGAAQTVSEHRPKRGRLVVFFQAAEETGQGALAAINDPNLDQIRPDAAIAIHNLPGFALGDVIGRGGPFASASRGLTVELEGRTSHASEPEKGRSPALALAQIIQAWSAAPQLFSRFDEAMQVTVIHATLGRIAFGTSPGQACVMATLRAHRDEAIDRLDARLRQQAKSIATAFDLQSSFSVAEPFPATNNDPQLVQAIEAAAREAGLSKTEPEQPFAWSEDFGHFAKVCPSALIGLGAGRDHPSLHHPDYDFPDELIPYGVCLFEAIIRRLLS